MGILIMQYRKQQLQAKKNNLEYKLLDLDEQINNYTQFSSTLSSDSISATDLASIPASLFDTGVTSIFQMQQTGQQYANQKMSQMPASIFEQQSGGNADYAAYLQQLTYQKLYEEGQKQYKKLIQAQLNEKEKELQRQRTTINTQLTMTDEELKNVENRLANDAKDAVAGYGLGGG